ncbi:hypothetical protein LQZ18_05460 [Lachnospiraceae bacterium ZAX-1]
MEKKFYAKGSENEGYIKNMEILAVCDLKEDNSGGQQQLYRTVDGTYLLYHLAAHGTKVVIIDVTDPANPKVLNSFHHVDVKEYPTTDSPKIQIADGLLIIAMTSGSGPNFLHRPQIDKKTTKFMSGIQIFSLEDPVNPRFLSYWDCGVPFSMGVHRFMYDGGRYVHLSCECAPFEGLIYRIVDINDPENPVEAGRWWLPEQYADGVPGRSVDHDALHVPDFMDKGWLHGPPFIVGDKAYLGYAGAGLIVLDVADVTRPKCLGHLPLCPPFGSHFAGARTHTALPLPGRDLVVVTNEGERYFWFTAEQIGNMAQAMNNLHMVDVRDPARPTLIAEFPYPEVPEGFPYKNFNEAWLGVAGPFGPHNVHEPMAGKPWLEQRGDRVYCSYFAAGFRAYDVSDPYYIKEIAYFIPPNPAVDPLFPGKGPIMAVTEDNLVDDRGNIYITTDNDGFYIARLTV